MEQAGMLVDALKAYRDVYALDAHNQDAILGLGRVSFELGNVELAFEFFVKLLIENHSHPWGYWGRAAVFFEYGQSDRALHELSKALDLDAPPTDLRIDCAALLNSGGFHNEAIAALRPLLGSSLFDEDAEIEWCLAALNLKQIDENTAQFIQKNECNNKNNEAIWLLLSGMYKNLVSPGAGELDIRRALTLDADLSEKINLSEDASE